MQSGTQQLGKGKRPVDSSATQLASVEVELHNELLKLDKSLKELDSARTNYNNITKKLLQSDKGYFKF